MKPAVNATNLLLALILSACSTTSDDPDDGLEACFLGTDPMPQWRVNIPSCDPDCYWMYYWDVSGDATVVTVSNSGDLDYRIELYFVEDATTVSIDISLPDATMLPVAQGDQVFAWVGVDAGWTYGVWANIHDLDRQLLLGMGSGGANPDATAPPCPDTQTPCGVRGYPVKEICHPHRLQNNDFSAPCALLRRGQSAVLSHNGVTMKYYLQNYWIHTTMNCTDMTPAWSSQVAYRIL